MWKHATVFIFALVIVLLTGSYFIITNNTTKTANEEVIKSLKNKNISKIQIRDGMTGEHILIIEKEKISSIINQLVNKKKKKIDKVEDSTGWTYSLKIYSKDSVLLGYTFISNEKCLINGTCYKIIDNNDIIKFLKNFFHQCIMNPRSQTQD